MKPGQPNTRSEILQKLGSVEEEVASFFASLSDEEFVLRIEDAWSPAEHLMHLNTSVSAVGRGLLVRRWLLRLRFGRSGGPSRSFEALRDDYLSRIAAGAKASGPYVPPREEASLVLGRRAEILGRWNRVNARLRTALEDWSERDLDRLRLPHPLLGKVTIREMLFFTIFHNEHHVAAAKRRIPRFGGVGPVSENRGESPT